MAQNTRQTSLWSREELDRAWEEYLNREPFSYAHEDDPLYQQYRERYLTEGKRAMEDTVGLASTLTGGYANSYAQIAGQQSYEQYLDRLNDVIPELYDRAYRQYQAEGEALYDELLLRQKQLEAQEEPVKSGSSGGSGGGSGSTGSSGGYSRALIMEAQALVGAEVDGIWGQESAQKASRYGFYSLKDVIEKGLNISYDYVKKTMLKQLGHDRGVITEYDFLVARNNDGGPEIYLQYKDYRAYLMDVLRQIYA